MLGNIVSIASGAKGYTGVIHGDDGVRYPFSESSVEERSRLTIGSEVAFETARSENSGKTEAVSVRSTAGAAPALMYGKITYIKNTDAGFFGFLIGEDGISYYFDDYCTAIGDILEKGALVQFDPNGFSFRGKKKADYVQLAEDAGGASMTGKVIFLQKSARGFFGFIAGADGTEYYFTKDYVAEGETVERGSDVSFEAGPVSPNGQPQAVWLRVVKAPSGTPMTGCVVFLKKAGKGFYGFINGDDGIDYHFNENCLEEGFTPARGESVAFEISDIVYKGHVDAIHVHHAEPEERKIRLRPEQKRPDFKKRVPVSMRGRISQVKETADGFYGFIEGRDGADYYFDKAGIEGGSAAVGQEVVFEVGPSLYENKKCAVRVRIAEETQPAPVPVPAPVPAPAAASSDPFLIGRVTCLKRTGKKFFGFIEAGDGQEYYFDETGVAGTSRISNGAEVAFETGRLAVNGKPRAVRIQSVAKAKEAARAAANAAKKAAKEAEEAAKEAAKKAEEAAKAAEKAAKEAARKAKEAAEEAAKEKEKEAAKEPAKETAKEIVKEAAKEESLTGRVISKEKTDTGFSGILAGGDGTEYYFDETSGAGGGELRRGAVAAFEAGTDVRDGRRKAVSVRLVKDAPSIPSRGQVVFMRKFAKGAYGFVRREDGKECYFDKNDVESVGLVKVGSEVVFESEPAPYSDKERAVHVRLVSEEAAAEEMPKSVPAIVPASAPKRPAGESVPASAPASAPKQTAKAGVPAEAPEQMTGEITFLKGAGAELHGFVRGADGIDYYFDEKGISGGENFERGTKVAFEKSFDRIRKRPQALRIGLIKPAFGRPMTGQVTFAQQTPAGLLGFIKGADGVDYYFDENGLIEGSRAAQNGAEVAFEIGGGALYGNVQALRVRLTTESVPMTGSVVFIQKTPAGLLGFIAGADGRNYYFDEAGVTDGSGAAKNGTEVTFDSGDKILHGNILAVHVRCTAEKDAVPMTGKIIRIKAVPSGVCGFIKGADGIESSFDESCVMKGSAPAIGSGVSFARLAAPDGKTRAIRVRPEKKEETTD